MELTLRWTLHYWICLYVVVGASEEIFGSIRRRENTQFFHSTFHKAFNIKDLYFLAGAPWFYDCLGISGLNSPPYPPDAAFSKSHGFISHIHARKSPKRAFGKVWPLGGEKLGEWLDEPFIAFKVHESYSTPPPLEPVVNTSTRCRGYLPCGCFSVVLLGVWAAVFTTYTLLRPTENVFRLDLGKMDGQDFRLQTSAAVQG